MEQVRKTVPQDEEGRINLQAYWKVFWRKKFYLLVPLCLSALVAVVGVGRLTPIYESHTMLQMEDKNILSPGMERYVQTNGDNRDQLRNQRFRAMIETRVTSNDFLRLIVEDLGLQRAEEARRSLKPDARAASGELPVDELVMRHLIGMLKKKVVVQNPTGGFFTVGVFDTDPATAYILAEKVAEKFIEVTRQSQILGVREVGAFSDEQLAIYKEKLDASEKELGRVRREMATTEVVNNPVNAENIHFAQALKQTVRADAERGGIALRRVRERLVSLANVAPTSDRIVQDETVRNCENQLIAFGEEKLLRDLQGSDQPEVPPDQFNEATAALRSRLTELVPAEYPSVARDMRPLIIEYYYQRSLSDYYSFVDRKLQSFIDQYSRSYERKPSLEREFNRLTQEVEASRGIYKAFLEQKTSARITEAAQSTNVGLSMTIIQRAERPITPVQPDPIKIILLSVLFGLVCGIGAILITEYLDDSFRGIEEVERTMKLSVLGTVPKMAEGFTWERRRRGLVIAGWIAGVVLFVALMSGALFVYASYLKSSGLGIELTEDRPAAEVQE